MVTKPQNAYELHRKALAQYSEVVRNHVWSFQTGSFYDFDQTIKKERALYAEGVKLGMDGVMVFVQEQMEAIERYMQPRLEQELNRAIQAKDRHIQHLEEKIEGMRRQYMTPFDFFKEKVDRHDFWYHMSDDPGVYRRGKAYEESIEADVKANGPEFAKYWTDWRAEQIAASERVIAKQREEKAQAARTPPLPLTFFSDAKDHIAMRVYLDKVTTPKNTCENWFLRGEGDSHPAYETSPVDSSVFFGADGSGRTTKIVGFSANTRRVLTQTGSVYQLGTPNSDFAKMHRRLVQSVGFD